MNHPLNSAIIPVEELEAPIKDKHYQEWLASGVAPEIIDTNVQSLAGEAALEAVLYAALDKVGGHGHQYSTGEVSTLLGRYETLEKGGWCCFGLELYQDAEGNWQQQRMEWGCFKPDFPRINWRESDKKIKYEHPPKTPTQAFFLSIPSKPRFWLEVLTNHEIPIIIVEGAKKAGCLLSLGYAAIALPGIFNGYRKATKALIQELAIFANKGRKVFICFDHDKKSKTIENVKRATSQLGRAFAKKGCQVKIIDLPGPEKGVDDFVVVHGREAFAELYKAALPLNRSASAKAWQLSLPVTLRLNQRYLGLLPFPKSGFALIKSAKGTGKTKSLERLIREASRSGRKVLVITHRVQLGRKICNDIGIDWIEDAHNSVTAGLLGYGLCIDSLHPDSQAAFDPEDWEGAIVVIDELEQVVWHALNSTTCTEKRVKILSTLRDLIHIVIASGGLIIGQDADLSDISVDFLLSCTDTKQQPWVVVNDWKPEQGSDVTVYDSKNPAPLIAQMASSLEKGAIFIAVDSQKVTSKHGSKNLETWFRKQSPDKKILRIDSETVSDPASNAYGVVEKLNEVIKNYDIVIATPTIGTGVSIDVKDHFAAVFGIFQGAIPEAETRQFLARVRDNVPRYVWARTFGVAQIGSGGFHYLDIIDSAQGSLKYNLQLLDVHFDLDNAFDPVALRTWAKMAARINVGQAEYREALFYGLLAEGHNVVISGDGDDGVEAQTIKEEMKEIRNENRQAEAEEVADADEIDEKKYLELKDKRAKEKIELDQQKKYELNQRYGVEVTPSLKIKDDDGWYSKIRLHYFLLMASEVVAEHDCRHLDQRLMEGNGKLHLPDVKLYSAKIKVFKVIDFLKLMNPDKEIRASDPEIQQITEHFLKHRKDIKAVLNIGVTEEFAAKPIQLLQRIAGSLGLKLECNRQERLPEGGRARVYRFVPPCDGREEVFAVWRERDTKMLEIQAEAMASGTTSYIDSLNNSRLCQFREEAPHSLPSDAEVRFKSLLLQLTQPPSSNIRVTPDPTLIPAADAAIKASQDSQEVLDALEEIFFQWLQPGQWLSLWSKLSEVSQAKALEALSRFSPCSALST
jgi:hypothetical protein